MSEAQMAAAIRNCLRATEVAKTLRFEKDCVHCGKHFVAKRNRAKFCSIECNWRSRKPKPGICKMCGSATKKRNIATCSPACYKALFNKIWDSKPGRKAYECQQCHKPFIRPRSMGRKFCSYACHIKSGGALRAGAAASVMARIYGAKKDANHSLIVEALEAAGAGVIDLSGLGKGLPDLLVWCKGKWNLVEIKNPKTSYGRRGANKLQIAWAKDWKGGPVYIVRRREEATALANGDTESLEQVETYYSVNPVEEEDGVADALKAVKG